MWVQCSGNTVSSEMEKVTVDFVAKTNHLTKIVVDFVAKTNHFPFDVQF
jgi:hypothetical protein